MYKTHWFSCWDLSQLLVYIFTKKNRQKKKQNTGICFKSAPSSKKAPTMFSDTHCYTVCAVTYCLHFYMLWAFSKQFGLPPLYWKCSQKSLMAFLNYPTWWIFLIFLCNSTQLTLKMAFDICGSTESVLLAPLGLSCLCASFSSLFHFLNMSTL